MFCWNSGFGSQRPQPRPADMFWWATVSQLIERKCGVMIEVGEMASVSTCTIRYQYCNVWIVLP